MSGNDPAGVFGPERSFERGLGQVAELSQFTLWLLSWGDGMEVLEPLELRIAIAKTTMRMAKQHAAIVQTQLASPA